MFFDLPFICLILLSFALLISLYMYNCIPFGSANKHTATTTTTSNIYRVLKDIDFPVCVNGAYQNLQLPRLNHMNCDCLGHH